MCPDEWCSSVFRPFRLSRFPLLYVLQNYSSMTRSVPVTLIVVNEGHPLVIRWEIPQRLTYPFSHPLVVYPTTIIQRNFRDTYNPSPVPYPDRMTRHTNDRNFRILLRELYLSPSTHFFLIPLGDHQREIRDSLSGKKKKETTPTLDQGLLSS